MLTAAIWQQDRGNSGYAHVQNNTQIASYPAADKAAAISQISPFS